MRTHFSISALVDIVDSVEREREREVLIELDDFDDCTEEKEDADFSLDWWSSYLSLWWKDEIIEVILFITCETYKMLYLSAASSFAQSKFYKIK